MTVSDLVVMSSFLVMIDYVHEDISNREETQHPSAQGEVSIVGDQISMV